MEVAGIRAAGRSTQGVRLINGAWNDRIGGREGWIGSMGRRDGAYCGSDTRLIAMHRAWNRRSGSVGTWILTIQRFRVWDHHRTARWMSL